MPFWDERNGKVKSVPAELKAYCINDVLNKVVLDEELHLIPEFLKEFKKGLFRSDYEGRVRNINCDEFFVDEELIWKALMELKLQMNPWYSNQISKAKDYLFQHGYNAFLSNYGMRLQHDMVQRTKMLQEEEHREIMHELTEEAAKLENKKKKLEIRKLQIDINRARAKIRRV